MTWLLRLYPRAWRQRYAGEVADLLAGRRFSLRIAIDLVAGAIDVWLHPAETLAAATAAATARKDETMLSRILRFDCAGAYGRAVSKEDAWKSGLTMIGVTLILTLAWVPLHIRFDDDAVVDSVGMLPFMIGMLASMRYTYLKGRSPAVQAIFIGGGSLLMAAIFVLAGLIAARL